MDNQEVSIIKDDDGKIYEVVVAKNPVERKQITDALERLADQREQLTTSLASNAEGTKQLEAELVTFDELVPPTKPNRTLRRKKK